MNIFQSAMQYLTEHSTAILSGLGVVVAIAKMFSTEKAGPVISKVQALVDTAATLVMGLGSLLKMMSDMLANLIKSDGFLGKK